MYKTVLELLEETQQRYPEKIAFGDDSSEITYSELLNKAQAIGTFLIDKIMPCSPVAFFLEKSTAAVCGMFGAVYVRGFYSFLDVRQPNSRIESILEILAPKVILTDRIHCEKIKCLNYNAEVFCIEDLLNNEIDKKRLEQIRKDAQDIDPLYVNFTSGSTGIPKGVTVCHRSVLEFIQYFVDIFHIDSDDVIGNQAPFDFDVSTKDIYSGLATGARVQIIPRSYFSAPIQLMDYLVEKQVTTLIWAVSAMCFVSIMNGFEYRNPTLIKKVLFSGEVLPVKHLNKWKKYLPDAMFVNLYGPTEITCNCTYYVLQREFDENEIIPIGKPFPNEKVFLLDDNNHLVTEPGVVGEICISGTTLALGYYKDQEKTNQFFVQNPLNSCYHEIIYRTGDLGKYNFENELIYVSRKDFQIKHLGQRIELGEIETAAIAMNGVTRTCCIYDGEKKKIILFYTGDECSKKDVLSELKEVLPLYMLPNNVIQLEEMPMNKNGKIDRNELMKLYKNK